MAYEAYWLIFTARSSGSTDIGDVAYAFSFDADSILSAISLTMRGPDEWLPEEYNPLTLRNMLLRVTAQPIVVTASPEHTTLDRFILYLIYPEQGFEIWYLMNFSNYPEICIDAENIRQLQLHITVYPDDLTQDNGDSRIPIEEGSPLTGITGEDFVRFFREHPDECLNLVEYQDSSQ